MTDKLKRKIFKKLYSDLNNVEIISYNDSIWFIDREKKYWYLEYCKNGGQLWWRYNFFPYFFKIFALERKEYEPIMSEWVEKVLNSKVSKTNFTTNGFFLDSKVDEILLNFK